MMSQIRKTFSFSDFCIRLLETVLRFPVTIVLCQTLFLLFLGHGGETETLRCAEGAVIALSVAIICEGRVKMWLNGLISASVVAIWGLFCYLILGKEPATSQIIQELSITACFVVAIFTALFYKPQPDDRQFWNYCKTIIIHALIAFALSLILMVGLYVATLFTSILGLDLFGISIATFCMFVVFPICTLCYIPKGEGRFVNSLDFNKLLKIITQYLLQPLVALYFIILYCYLISILAHWSLPEGKVTYLVTTSVGAYLVLLLLSYPAYVDGESRIFRFLARWGALFALPLVILMSVSIGYRIRQYGITINRGYVLVANIWFYGILTFLFVTKSRRIKWIPITFALLFLLTSFGPWSISNLSFQKISHKILTTCENEHILQDGKIEPDRLSEYCSSQRAASKNFNRADEVTNLMSEYSYLTEHYPKSQFEKIFPRHGKENIAALDYQFFGDPCRPGEDVEFCCLSQNDNVEIDISDYQMFACGDKWIIHKNDVEGVTYQGKSFTIPKSFFVEKGRKDSQDLVYQGEDFILIPNTISFGLYDEKGKGKFNSIQGEFKVFYKKKVD